MVEPLIAPGLGQKYRRSCMAEHNGRLLMIRQEAKDERPGVVALEAVAENEGAVDVQAVAAVWVGLLVEGGSRMSHKSSPLRSNKPETSTISWVVQRHQWIPATHVSKSRADSRRILKLGSESRSLKSLRKNVQSLRYFYPKFLLQIHHYSSFCSPLTSQSTLSFVLPATNFACVSYHS